MESVQALLHTPVQRGEPVSNSNGCTEHSKNSDSFCRWRPKFHIMSPRGWMNDPCAPGFNKTTGVFHVGFQWNPNDCVWGDMCWGSATSSDLVSWSVAPHPSIKADAALGECGVFTGCLVPIDPSPESNHAIAAFYTSAQKLPITYAGPYHRGSEKLYMITSTDNGLSWQRDCESLILSEPPKQLSVTGWRDPFVASWKSVDELFGHHNDDFLYGVISGGLRGETPTIFLYRIHKKTLNRWEELGPMINIGLNFNPSRWTGDFGLNWEVVNFLTFSADAGQTKSFLIISAEGVNPAHTHPPGPSLLGQHMQKWMRGTLIRGDHGLQMRFEYGGTLDHGCFYAANAFWDSNTQQYIAFGWIMEDDLPSHLVREQQWSGALSIPRIIKMQTLQGVAGALVSDLDKLSSFEKKLGQSGTCIMSTLACIPDPRLSALRQHKSSISPGQLKPSSTQRLHLSGRQSAQWELHAVFHVNTAATSIGIEIAHSPDFSLFTTIVFYPETETVVIDRSKSTGIESVNLTNEIAPHTLFTFRDEMGYESREELSIHAFFDASIMEVFVNGRTAITTRIYTESATCFTMKPFVQHSKVGGSTTEQELSMISQFDLYTLCSAITQYETS